MTETNQTLTTSTDLNKRKQTLLNLEVNTAPALENEETLHAYTNAIRNTKKEVN